MTFKDLNTNDEFEAGVEIHYDDVDLEPVEQEIDEFYDMAVFFARLSLGKGLPAKRRRKYERLSDLCDRASFAKCGQRRAREVAVFTALSQLEKSLSADVRRAAE
jgi:hypothetical protein